MASKPPASKRALMPSLNSLIKQLEDPRSLVSFLPKEIQPAFLSIPEEYINVDENELLEKLVADGYTNWKPSIAHERLRLNFWMEYDRVSLSRSNEVMNPANIYLGVVSKMAWSLMLREHPNVLAYILIRPIEYEQTYEALQVQANRKFHEILSLPIREAGKLNIKLLELQMKTAAMVDLRNKGGYLNRSETKNLTMLSQKTEHTYTQVLDAKVSDKSASEIEADIKDKLKMLEEEARMQLPPPAPRFEETVVVEANYTDVTKRDD